MSVPQASLQQQKFLLTSHLEACSISRNTYLLHLNLSDSRYRFWNLIQRTNFRKYAPPNPTSRGTPTRVACCQGDHFFNTSFIYDSTRVLIQNPHCIWLNNFIQNQFVDIPIAGSLNNHFIVLSKLIDVGKWFAISCSMTCKRKVSFFTRKRVVWVMPES